MQSKLATAAVKFIATRSRSSNHFIFTRRLAFASGSVGGTADSNDDIATYPKDPGSSADVANPKPAKEDIKEEPHYKMKEETEPIEWPNPPQGSSPRLKSNEVKKQPIDPHFQQKRRNSRSQDNNTACAGVDPWSEQEVKEEERGNNNREQTESDREYFKDRKASPLSEIQVADTRRPVTQATDGTASSVEVGAGKDVVGWKPEQVDTAEDSLKRGAEMFKRSAMRGDPDVFPSSRILREMRGEWF